jgi:hypothetical protein
MADYKVSATQYFSELSDSVRFSDVATFTGTKENIEACEKPMQGIIARYNIRNSKILSLACGTAFEEKWFYESGNRLTLNDLDVPNYHTERYLKYLDKCEGDGPDCLTFFIEDAAETAKLCKGKGFDFLYISSFHPDEIRKGNLQKEYNATRSLFDRVRNPATWPPNEKPYLPVMMEVTKAVKDNGIIIFQHYAHGVDLYRNPQYLTALKDQFGANGNTLLEVYCFKKAPAIILLSAFRGSEEEAKKYLSGIQNNPAITQFHGRYPNESIKTNIDKVYDLYTGKMIKPIWKFKWVLQIFYRSNPLRLLARLLKK